MFSPESFPSETMTDISDMMQPLAEESASDLAKVGVSPARFNLTMIFAAVRQLLFFEEDNPVRVCAAAHVIHTPYVGCLGECLGVDHHRFAGKAGGNPERDDVFFKP